MIVTKNWSNLNSSTVKISSVKSLSVESLIIMSRLICHLTRQVELLKCHQSSDEQCFRIILRHDLLNLASKDFMREVGNNLGKQSLTKMSINVTVIGK